MRDGNGNFIDQIMLDRKKQQNSLEKKQVGRKELIMHYFAEKNLVRKSLQTKYNAEIALGDIGNG